MKEKLKQIFLDLSNGKLSPDVALQRIREVKLRQDREDVAMVLAAPAWEPDLDGPTEEGRSASAGAHFQQRHIILCGIAHPDTERLGRLVPDGRFRQLPRTPRQNIAEQYGETALACFQILQEILEAGSRDKVLIQIVIPNTPEEVLPTGLSGMLKTAALENPRIAGQIILTEPAVDADKLAEQLLECRSGPVQTVIKYQEGRRHLLRWRQIPANPAKTAVAFKDRGVYLITGGLGGLGVLFSSEILQQTRQATLILTGRAELSPRRQAILEKLSARGGVVEYRQLDVTDLSQVRQLVDAVIREHKQVNGIIHSAGMSADNFIIKKSAMEFRKVLAPKVTGAWNLDIASQDIDLDFMVLFSSLTSWLGNPGQADYAAANGFLDQFAAYRNHLAKTGRRKGLTQSICWPLWQEGGMQPDHASREMLISATGIQLMQTRTGMHAFYCSLARQRGRIIAMEGNPEQIRRTLQTGQMRQRRFGSSRTRETATEPAAASQPAAGNLAEQTRDFLCKQFGAILNLNLRQIDPRAPLEKYGFNSILAMKLINRLENTFGTLSKTLLFEYQSIHELSDYFLKYHADQAAALFAHAPAGSDDEPETAASRTSSENTSGIQGLAGNRSRFAKRLGRRGHRAADVPARRHGADAIAIIGLSGRYPQAVDISEFWDNLREGRDCITEVPASRWDWRRYYSEDRTRSGYHHSKWGGFIAGVDEFDPRFFNISPREAETLDPQERLFLQHAWMAVEDAGYTRAGLQLPDDSLLPGPVGVYVGVMYGEYNLSGSLASIANRVSYVLNLHGPSITLDTMCSSSLTAIHLACQDLKQNRTRMAIAGGVNVTIHPNKYLTLSTGQFISSDGHCQSFGEGGDGYIPGEGVGAVVLKKLSDAQRDGDHIYGTILGSALNHGGKTNGYTVPNPRAQADVIVRALAEANIDPRHISYIEAHGTGTRLGDPIEITALSKAFEQYTRDTGFCLIGSAKSNIGHCESAAGIAGITKVLLQMKHRQIVPSLHSKRLNPHIDFDKTPFIVNQTLKPWDPLEIDGRAIPRIAGISSFGAGGSNAHIVMQEYAAPARAEQSTAAGGQQTTVIIPLSARTKEQLAQKARDLLHFIRAWAPEAQTGPSTPPLDLASLAYTLQVGREAMDVRLGIVTDSPAGLADKLQAYLDGAHDIENLYQGRVEHNQGTLALFGADPDLQQTIDLWITQRKLSKLSDLWVKGLDLDWNKFHGDVKPRRMSLPTYPFARERYWTAAFGEQSAPASALPNLLHPLIHTNTSDLSRQSYGTTFSGREFVLTDHLVSRNGDRGQKVLSAAVYLEMARAAVELAVPEEQKTNILELAHVAWSRPMAVTDQAQVHIALDALPDDAVAYDIYTRHPDGELVLCQGHALPDHKPTPAGLDLDHLRKQMHRGGSAPDTLYRTFAGLGIHYGPAYRAISAVHEGDDQLLAELTLPAILENTRQDYFLHPSLLDGALQACIGLVKDSTRPALRFSLPDALDALRIISACTRKMYAWVRRPQSRSTPADAVKLDIDLCDSQGRVCVQMRGVTYQPGPLGLITSLSGKAGSDAGRQASEEKTTAPPAPRIIPFHPSEPFAFAQEQPGKPVITLTPPGPFLPDRTRQTTPGHVAVILSDPASASGIARGAASASSAVSLYDHGNGIFLIEISAAENNTLSKEVISQLLQAMAAVKRSASVRVLILTGTQDHFLHGARAHYNSAMAQDLFGAIVSFPYPVIAAMQGDASGPGFLVGALCDFMICSRQGRYQYTDPSAGVFPTAREDRLFKERFGRVQATDFLYLNTTATGLQLQQSKWRCPIPPGDRVLENARQLASNLARKPQKALGLLKQHLVQPIKAQVGQLTLVPPVAGQATAHPARVGIASRGEHIQLETHNQHVLVIRIRATADQGGLKALVVDLGDIFGQVNAADGYKAVVLVSESPSFLPPIGMDPSETIVDLQNHLLDSRIPVVAVLDADAKGLAWFITQFCDAAVYNEKGHYVFEDDQCKPTLIRQAAMIFAHRLGDHLGREIVLTGKAYTGSELRQSAGALNVAGRDQAFARALALAGSWAALSRDHLLAWKRHTTLHIREMLAGLTTGPEPEARPAGPLPAAPAPVDLDTRVISATAHPEGILVVEMQDRQAKNMFSEEFLAGMSEVFDHIEQTPAYKVVVLTGYDTYFASGGTRESLLAIQEGKARFTDHKIYHLAMACKVPVIAAMQGHAIGAGWSMGMFADFTLFSEDSRYVSPYMDYGFTPGAGATLIIPEKMGHDLARETLMTAQFHDGGELKDRGLLLPVMPGRQVVPAAMAMARKIAQGSRDSLVAVKRQFTRHLRQRLEETYARELAMHEETFVGQPEALQRIQSNFVSGADVPTANVDPGPAQGQPETPAKVGPSTDADTVSRVTETIKDLLAHELRLQAGEIDENVQFVDLGLDSIMGVTWIRKINEAYQTSIEATKIYSYPTLAQLSRHVKDEAQKAGAFAGPPPAMDTGPALPKNDAADLSTPPRLTAETGRVPFRTPLLRKSPSRIRPADSSGRQTEPVAVIGMAGQFPMANNLEAFWDNIARGKNCISEIPPDRWDIDTYYVQGNAESGKTNSKWMGALEAYDRFDPVFFNMAPTEAEYMDPQQRVFLQTCWHAMEDAGYHPDALSGSRCGVFAGCGGSDYQLLSRKQQTSAYGFTGSATSILAARISYFLNLQGPCLSIETACSSSLVAIATACDSLNSGGSDLALAGGVFIMVGPNLHIKTSQTGMLSPDGRCFVFDRRANGFVPGEAVGVVMLKRLSDAIRDEDIISGVIHGWGVNQDGRTNGITAPNAESQARLEKEVYDKYNIDPAGLQMIEAHGTGTRLGDPIEVEALKASFEKYTDKKAYCALGSVKSNIGHCLTAAGIASFLKVLLALKHKKLPPTINFEHLNAHIDLTDSPFYVNQHLRDWEPPGAGARKAAVSSFGFSGTNAHVVIGEYQPPAKDRKPVVSISRSGRAAIVLSAKSEDQLKQRARDLLDFIRKEGPSVDLMDMAYTLQTGREAMPERLGLSAGSTVQLVEKLQAFVDGAKGIDELYQGSVQRDKDAMGIINQDDDMKTTVVERWISQHKLSRLLELWVKGLALNWEQLYGDAKPRRMRLPAYPFARERYWIDGDETETAQTTKQTAPSGRLHPLLHNKVADLCEQGCNTDFTKEHFLFTIDRVAAGKSNGARIQRIALPTYPFDRERCWVDDAAVGRNADDRRPQPADFKSVEDILDLIDTDAMETDEAVKMLKTLV